MTHLLQQSAYLVFLFMLFVFVYACLIKDNSIVDVAWGIGFIIIAWTTWSGSARSTLVTTLVTLWGLRLSTYIAIRRRGHGEDPRYAAWRAAWKYFYTRSFFQVFMLQGFLMVLIALPIIWINQSLSTSFTTLDYIGVVIWAIGFGFESIGDLQLYLFKNNPASKGKVLRTGLWRYTRHPNYFGEAVLWWGVYILCLSTGGWQWFVSPLLLTVLLLKVSGVTMLEKRYEGNDKYSLYKKSTSSFIPWIPKS